MSKKKKVLVIDDEEMHLYTAKALLEAENLEVETYQGAFGATNFVKSCNPDLVLLDINMPALSGNNLVSHLKPFCAEREIPIFFYSSNDEAMLRNLVAVHGVHGYICKGDVAALRERVTEVLARK
ncbi:response regulator [Geomonas sp. Red276]